MGFCHGHENWIHLQHLDRQSQLIIGRMKWGIGRSLSYYTYVYSEPIDINHWIELDFNPETKYIAQKSFLTRQSGLKRPMEQTLFDKATANPSSQLHLPFFDPAATIKAVELSSRETQFGSAMPSANIAFTLALLPYPLICHNCSLRLLACPIVGCTRSYLKQCSMLFHNKFIQCIFSLQVGKQTMHDA